ncbi:MAG: Fe-S cluster assembly ATPase SufC [Verrucomicrobia bacterium]|nr:Fe-S cluster assembly ATPase SufC [Verrucomicrobiota bacterium]
MLTIKELTVEASGSEILKDFSLDVKRGEIHAIMGPNGAGKSTLAKVLAGHPFYDVTKGEALLEGTDLLLLDPEERAKAGLFMSFQYPLEIKGITNLEFLRHAYNALYDKTIESEAFRVQITPILEMMRIKEAFLDRDLNDGFSGGEKKRNEILQLLALQPKCALLDETDSGLDIDALKVVAQGVNAFMDEGKSLILITHYQRLLDYIRPDFVHIMVAGKIVKTGDYTLAHELEAKGYEMVGV